MKKKSSRQQNRFLRIITIPFRAFCKARDFYVKSMMDCATGNAIGLQGASNAPGLPRSFSVASSTRSSNDSSEDFRELVRAASARTAVGPGMIRHQEVKVVRNGMMPPRSVSVAMARIDEERAYAGDDVNGDSNIGDMKKIELIKYPRSRSHPVATPRAF